MDTLIGLVPDDWALAALRSVSDIQAGPSGTNLRSTDRVAAGVPVVVPKNLRNGRVVGHDVGHIAPETANKLARYRLRGGDVLCTRTGELGQCGRVTDDQEGWLFATGLLRLRPGHAVRAGYLVHYLTLPAIRDWVDRHVTGTTVPTISVQAYSMLPVVVPPLEVQNAIGEVLGLLDEKVDIHERISQSTARLRDKLAPLLMTGAMPAGPLEMVDSY